MKLLIVLSLLITNICLSQTKFHEVASTHIQYVFVADSIEALGWVNNDVLSTDVGVDTLKDFSGNEHDISVSRSVNSKIGDGSSGGGTFTLKTDVYTKPNTSTTHPILKFDNTAGHERYTHMNTTPNSNWRFLHETSSTVFVVYRRGDEYNDQTFDAPLVSTITALVSAQNGYWLIHDVQAPQNQIELDIKSGNSTRVNLETPTGSVPTSTTDFFTIMVLHDEPADTAAIFINDTLSVSGSSTDPTTGNDPQQKFGIGKAGGANTYWEVWAVAVWDTILTDIEITEIQDIRDGIDVESTTSPSRRRRHRHRTRY